MTKFQVGKTYGVRSICDHNCIFCFKVVSRTVKTVTLKYHGSEVRRKVRLDGNTEACDPMGRYSMSPYLTADREVA